MTLFGRGGFKELVVGAPWGQAIQLRVQEVGAAFEAQVKSFARYCIR